MNVCLWTVLLMLGSPARTECVGVSNHAYYSWACQLLEGTGVEVLPLLPVGADPHGFAVGPEELEKVLRITILIANDLGHDQFLERMIAAAERDDLRRVHLHQGVPLIPSHPSDVGSDEHAFNPHTFLSFTTSVLQIRNLERQLQEWIPEHAEKIGTNAEAFVGRLRDMKRRFSRVLAGLGAPSVATVHDGYAYFLQEFGLEVAVVVQPKHGVEPSIKELADVVETIVAEDIDLILAEADAPRRYADMIAAETGRPVYFLSHLTGGAYRKEGFEQVMQQNAETLVRAVQEWRDGER